MVIGSRLPADLSRIALHINVRTAKLRTASMIPSWRVRGLTNEEKDRSLCWLRPRDPTKNKRKGLKSWHRKSAKDNWSRGWNSSEARNMVAGISEPHLLTRQPQLPPRFSWSLTQRDYWPLTLCNLPGIWVDTVLL